MKPKIVLSGVNFVEAGPLAVMQDAIEILATHFPQYEVHALVHSRNLFQTQGVVYHEYSEPKQSWLRRLQFEYVQCKSISEDLQPYLWLSMHDITPRVSADVQAVYCHNPAPFYRIGLREAFLSYRFALFSLLYRYLYGIGIQRNDYVVVQQEWMRGEFKRRYHPKRVVVAHPSVKHLPHSATRRRERQTDDPFLFFYPAFSRSFKNVEILLEATKLLEISGAPGFELRLTMDGSENRYSRQLRERYGPLRSVRWMGALSREQVMDQYAEIDAMLFPSRLETWGMPLMEFKETGKPICAADLPYAHETIGTYEAAAFLAPQDAGAWAAAMRGLCLGKHVLSSVTAEPIAQPFVEDWVELFNLLLSGENRAATKLR